MGIPGERFYKMSNAIFCYGLKPVELTVYSYLVCCAGNKEKCWPSMSTIAASCGCGVTTARKSVDALERRGFIRKMPTYFSYHTGENRQTNNTYYILDPPPIGAATPKAELIEVDSERSRA